MQIGQTEILLLPCIEDIAESEVAELHKIRDRFHDIPTVKVECAPSNGSELSDENR